MEPTPSANQQPPPLPARTTIRYHLTRGDLLAANFRALLRNRTLLVLWAVVIVFICASELHKPALAAHGLGYKVFFCAILAVLYFGSFLLLTFLVIGLMLLFRKNKGVLGEHQITLSDEGLTETTAYNESLHRWTAYHRTTRTRRYLLLYVNEGQAHIVPTHRSLLEGDLAAFEAELRRRTSR